MSQYAIGAAGAVGVFCFVGLLYAVGRFIHQFSELSYTVNNKHDGVEALDRKKVSHYDLGRLERRVAKLEESRPEPTKNG
jgi:hypothetical protein